MTKKVALIDQHVLARAPNWRPDHLLTFVAPMAVAMTFIVRLRESASGWRSSNRLSNQHNPRRRHGFMITVLDIINSCDCSLCLIAVILCVLGHRLVGADPSARTWGLRLAVAAFVVYCIYGTIHYSAASATLLLWVLIKAIVVSALMLGFSWSALPITAFAWRSTIGATWRTVYGYVLRVRLSKALRRMNQLAADLRRREQEEYDRQAPARERARQDAERRAQQEAVSQQRRDEARASCEILYALHAPEIAARFPKELFEDFVARHLSDTRPVEEVEKRARQLQDILREHLHKIDPPRKKLSIEDLTHWYQAMRQKIESLTIDDRAKRVQIAQLNERYRELMNHLMEELHP